MENYKEKLRINIIIYAIAAIILAVFSLLGLLSEAGLISLTPAAGDSHWHSMWRGFISGATCALLFFTIFGIVRCARALGSEKALKKLYVKQHDERDIKIWTSARAAAYQVFLILGIAAVVAAGYFDMVVSLTILGCIFFCSVIGLAFKIYYNRKF